MGQAVTLIVVKTRVYINQMRVRLVCDVIISHALILAVNQMALGLIV